MQPKQQHHHQQQQRKPNNTIGMTVVIDAVRVEMLLAFFSCTDCYLVVKMMGGRGGGWTEAKEELVSEMRNTTVPSKSSFAGCKRVANQRETVVLPSLSSPPGYVYRATGRRETWVR